MLVECKQIEEGGGKRESERAREASRPYLYADGSEVLSRAAPCVVVGGLDKKVQQRAARPGWAGRYHLGHPDYGDGEEGSGGGHRGQCELSAVAVDEFREPRSDQQGSMVRAAYR